MFSQFDDNPLAEENEIEVCVADKEDASLHGTAQAGAKRGLSLPTAEVEPRQKLSRHDSGSAKGDLLDADSDEVKTVIPVSGEVGGSGGTVTDTLAATAPYIGYSIEDAEEGEEENDNTDETYSSLICRVAELEVSLRMSAKTHRFQMNLAARERETLRCCMGRLRSLLKELQQERSKGVKPAGQEAARVDKPREKQPCSGVPHQVTLLELYDGVAQHQQLRSRMGELQMACGAGCGSSTRLEGYIFSAEDESWLSVHGADARDISPSPSPISAMDRFEELQCALEKLYPVLCSSVAQVVAMLMKKIRELCVLADTLSEGKKSLDAQLRSLDADFIQRVLWATERSLIGAEGQLSGYLDAAAAAQSERVLLSQRTTLLERLKSTEVVIATLLVAASSVQTTKVPPSVQQAVMKRREELQGLKAELGREVAFLRKLLKDRLADMWFLVGGGECTTYIDKSVDEGRSSLLQHYCAGLNHSLNILVREVTHETLKGSLSCAPSPEQEEELLRHELKTVTQHASIVSFLAENVRLYEHIQGTMLIKLPMLSGGGKLTPLAERLYTSQIAGRFLGLGKPHEASTEAVGTDTSGDNKEDAGATGDELDLLCRVVESFSTSTEQLVDSLNTHLKEIAQCFHREKHVCRVVAFLMRLTEAGNRLLLGKVGVPPLYTSYEDTSAMLESSKLHWIQPHYGLVRLPSPNSVYNALQSQSKLHADQSADKFSSAEKRLSELQKDVEWCRQQCPYAAGAELHTAQKELQQLKVSLSTVAPQERNMAALEAELRKSEEQLAQLRQVMLCLQEELNAAEAQCQLSSVVSPAAAEKQETVQNECDGVVAGETEIAVLNEGDKDIAQDGELANDNSAAVT
ncbi:hypothetical protein ERJ75_001618000 [Trypanosoma vivax]|uniref:Uncharacterized protein n=1 Tax=Trypanosoma vivax (strain Y486) TaxID=1055687 RepID=G0TTD0_TRYVY|nr:hypothetical protein TRVL_00580 [Trypanosoma vivax]KAH8605690.1 hypothetical protein ERJ75_001618000 [Trypanosoma vivax]CCC47211.1 conserved hypothetical protein [Trypanosoma vivax Y486]